LPDSFRLSVKAPRGLTHGRRLYAPEVWIERIGAGWHELGDKRAVLLVQLAPSHARDDARLAYFLRVVPNWIRLTAEFRHPSWHCEEVFALLEAHDVAGKTIAVPERWLDQRKPCARSYRFGLPGVSSTGQPGLWE